MQPQLGAENARADSLKHHLLSSAILLLNVSDCFSLHVVDGGFIPLQRCSAGQNHGPVRQSQECIKIPSLWNTNSISLNRNTAIPKCFTCAGVTLTVGCYFVVSVFLGLFVCACLWIQVAASILVLQDNVLSNWRLTSPWSLWTWC